MEVAMRVLLTVLMIQLILATLPYHALAAAAVADP
jgi:hypothetical protein